MEVTVVAIRVEMRHSTSKLDGGKDSTSLLGTDLLAR
jgi:hypothetical protein